MLLVLDGVNVALVARLHWTVAELYEFLDENIQPKKKVAVLLRNLTANVYHDEKCTSMSDSIREQEEKSKMNRAPT